MRFNSESQQRFVATPAEASAFIGGIGSGKTWAGIAKALQKTQVIGRYNGQATFSRGVIGAPTNKMLKMFIIPQIEEFCGMPRSGGRWLDWNMTTGESRFAVLDETGTDVGVATIWLCSFDSPEWMRGPNLHFFAIDEGKLVTGKVWDILLGRLRLKGFDDQQGWVVSSPNGYDWMWQLFHRDSPEHQAGYEWFNASTRDNVSNTGERYVARLEARYEGRYYRQELLGEFVGLTEGSVFPSWDEETAVGDVAYDPELPLYSFWDFGIGDWGVVLFAQISYSERKIHDAEGEYIASEWVPELRFIGLIAEKNWSIEKWAGAFGRYCSENFQGRRPEESICDPSGGRREMSGQSTIESYETFGIELAPAPRREITAGIIILDNMMAGARVKVDRERCINLARAFASHHWKTDTEGNKVGDRPIHDWSSHYADAARYGAMALLSNSMSRTDAPEKAPPGPGTIGYALGELDGGKIRRLGQSPRERIWTPPTIVPTRSGLTKTGR